MVCLVEPVKMDPMQDTTILFSHFLLSLNDTKFLASFDNDIFLWEDDKDQILQ